MRGNETRFVDAFRGNETSIRIAMSLPGKHLTDLNQIYSSFLTSDLFSKYGKFTYMAFLTANGTALGQEYVNDDNRICLKILHRSRVS